MCWESSRRTVFMRTPTQQFPCQIWSPRELPRGYSRTASPPEGGGGAAEGSPPRDSLRARGSLLAMRDHEDQPEEEEDEGDGQGDHPEAPPLDLPQFRRPQALGPAGHIHQILVIEVRLEARDGKISLLGLPLHGMKDDLLQDGGGLGTKRSRGDRISAEPGIHDD